MKTPDFRSPFRLGVVTLAATLVLGLVVVLLSRMQLGTSTYSATLESTGGLRVGEAVLVRGVESGSVTRTDLGGGGVVVTFTVDKEIRLGSATTAAVKVATLLGTHYLEVAPAGSGGLPDDHIRLANTSVPFNLQDVIDAGTKNVDELDTDALSRALGEIATVLKASGENTGPALKAVDRLSRAVVNRGDQFAALLQASKVVTRDLATSSGSLVNLVNQSNLVLNELTKRRAVIRTLLHDIRSLASTVSGIASDNRDQLRPALQRLNVVLDLLIEKKKELTELVDKVGVAGRYLANTLGTGPWAELYAPNDELDPVRCSISKDCK